MYAKPEYPAPNFPKPDGAATKPRTARAGDVMDAALESPSYRFDGGAPDLTMRDDDPRRDGLRNDNRPPEAASVEAAPEPAPAARVPDGIAKGRPSRAEAEAAVRTLLRWSGDDPDREGLRDTPARVANAYEQLFSGYAMDAEAMLARVFEEVEGYSDIVLVRDIPFHSHCEHHMVPFMGVAHIGYYPTRGVVGLSKLARVVDTFARRLQTQETMTAQIADVIEAILKPRGLAVMIEAEHLCMAMRGVQKSGVSTVTTQFRGAFRDEPNEQVRFLTLVRAAR